jgi:hypothetical protein
MSHNVQKYKIIVKQKDDLLCCVYRAYHRKAKSTNKCTRSLLSVRYVFSTRSMFRQIYCHLQGVKLKELQVIYTSKYTMYGFV